MNDSKILILNLDPTLCLPKTCDHLSEFIRRTFSNAEICYSTSVPQTVCHAFMPDIAFIHPGLTTLSPDVIDSLNKKWEQASVLGVFCEKGYPQIQKDCLMLHKFDDFLLSPFQERDIHLRLHKILHLKWKNTVVSESLKPKNSLHIHELVGRSKNFSRLLS